MIDVVECLAHARRLSNGPGQLGNVHEIEASRVGWTWTDGKIWIDPAIRSTWRADAPRAKLFVVTERDRTMEPPPGDTNVESSAFDASELHAIAARRAVEDGRRAAEMAFPKERRHRTMGFTAMQQPAPCEPEAPHVTVKVRVTDDEGNDRVTSYDVVKTSRRGSCEPR